MSMSFISKPTAERFTPKQIADLKLLGWHLEEDGSFRMFV
jgi:hypothetical protein